MHNLINPKEHGLPSFDDDFWKQKICVKPWTTLFIGGAGTTPCCLLFNNEYYELKHKFFNGPFHKGNLNTWNHEKFINLRQSMLDNGPKKTCSIGTPICHCKEEFPQLKNQIQSMIWLFEKERTIKTLIDIYHKKTVLENYPHEMGVSFTKKCNSACVFCLQRRYRIPENIMSMPKQSFDNVVKIINETKAVNLIGGEFIAMDKDYIEYIFSKFKKDLIVTIITNGKALDLDMYEMITSYCPNTKFVISLCNVSKKDLIEGKVKEDLFAFEKNIKEIYNKYPKNNIKHFTCVMIASVIPYLPDIMDFANKYNIKLFTLHKLAPQAMKEEGLIEEDAIGEGFNKEIFNSFMTSYEKMKEKSEKYNIKLLRVEEIKNIMTHLAEKNGYIK